MDSELTIAILREIRDEIRTTNSRIDALDRSLSGRIDALTNRVDGLEHSLGGRMDAIEHVLRDLAEQMLTVTRYVKNTASRHDDAIEDLRLRVGKLETRGA